jgi:hypothetical protein
MSKIKGTVSKKGESKFSHFVMLEEKDGFYFNTKFEPKCDEGDVVGIEFDQKRDNAGQISKIVVLEKGDGPKDSGGWDDKPSTSKSGGKSAPKGNATQDSIRWQAARNSALQAVEIILSVDGFATKGKADAKRLQVEALVDEITVRYYNDANDPKGSQAYIVNSGVADDAADSEEFGGDESKAAEQAETSAKGDWSEWD